MNLFDQLGSSFIINRESLKFGALVSLLSVWVLVALFYYLNRYTKRRYFTIWTAAWLFYALWITLSFGLAGEESRPLFLMLQQWCVGVSAVFLLWGSRDFLGENIRQGLLGWFMVFLLAWSYVGAYHLSKPEMELPAFWLISVASLMTAASFFKYRRKHSYIGATLLTLGFFMWSIYMAGYPFLESSGDFTSIALFISAGLQLLLAVSMIILVLEEVRETQHQAVQQAEKSTAERDALQTRVQSTEARYGKLFEHASEAIVITQADDFRILELNQAAERLLGITRAEAGRHTLTNFCQVKTLEGKAPQTSEEWFLTLSRQRPLNLVRKNGALTPVDINGALVEFDNKPAYQFFLLELTERAQLEQQLRQAEKLSAIGRMISGVAHELNNPLSVVKGYLELVLSHHELSPQTRADLEKAAHESNRAAKLVTSFLSFAREHTTARELIDLNALTQSLMELRHYDLLVAKTEVSLELDPNLPLVMANSDKIQQLLINLVNNALQAMVDLPHPGRLRIQTRTTGDLVQLLVEDDGPGVPPHLVDKIFEPFFTTKDVGAGTGLGLSLGHSTMSEYKGRIFYKTASIGGAGFVLEFPAGPARTAKEASGDTTTMYLAKPEKEPDPRSGRILVLDDEKSIAEMLGEMLGLLGFSPTVCHAPSKALELMERETFDLIISDFRMPGMNGRQFYELAEKKNPEMAKRIVFLTGDVVNEETKAFLKTLGTPHIAKPFTLANVQTVVDQALQAAMKGEAVGTTVAAAA